MLGTGKPDRKSTYSQARCFMYKPLAKAFRCCPANSVFLPKKAYTIKNRLILHHVERNAFVGFVPRAAEHVSFG